MRWSGICYFHRPAGLEASTGSLSQGPSIGIGHALAARPDDRDYRVCVMIGDGEADEGQVWEASMTAAKYKVSNLTAILDYNKFQQTGGAVGEVRVDAGGYRGGGEESGEEVISEK